MVYGIVVNNSYLSRVSLKEITSDVFSVAFNKYMSEDTIRNNLISACEMIYEFCELIRPSGKDEDSKKITSEISKMKGSLTKFLDIMSKLKNRDKLISFCYDFILSLEGKSRLRGFGFCSKPFNDVLRGNPERDSILFPM